MELDTITRRRQLQLVNKVLLICQLVVQEVKNGEALQNTGEGYCGTTDTGTGVRGEIMRINDSYPLLKISLFRIQLQLLKALNCFLKTLNCSAFVPKISLHIRNFGKRSR